MLSRPLKTKPPAIHFSKFNKSSFTLVELLVTIAVIGLLAAVVALAVNPARIKARDTKRMTDIKQITNALELAYAFNNSYPVPDGNATVCLSTCTASNWCANLKTQMSNIPNDPLPNQQCYLYNSDGANFRVAATFEASSNSFLAQNDGGLYDEYFEGQSTPGQILLNGPKYASAAGGNWSSDAGTWVTTSGGSTVTAHPVAGDTVYLDASSGNVTVDTNSACTTLDASAYVGTLAIGTNALAVSGNLSLGSGVGTTGTITIGTGATGLSVGGDFLVAARGVFTCSGNPKISSAGNWDVSAGVFTKDTSTVTFNATASGKTVKSGSNTYFNVTWNGSGGEWTLQDNFTQSRATLFTLGTLNLSGKTYAQISFPQTITLGTGFTLSIGTGYFNVGSGYATGNFTIPTGATVTISTGTLKTDNFTVSGTGTFTATGAAVISCFYDVNITSSNWNAGTSTLYQLFGTHTLSSTQPLYNYTVGSGNYSVAITLLSNLTVQNNFSIAYLADKTRSFSAGTYTINVGGNFTNGDTFTAGTSTVNFNDATKVSTISGTTTFNILQCLTPDKTVKFTAGTTTTVASFDFTGTAGHLITLDTNTGASTFTLADTTGTNQVEYCDIHRSTAGGGATWNALTSDGNVDGGGNSGWAF